MATARSFGLTRGERVAIEWISLYPHWLLMLAFESLGIVTFTYTRSGASDHGTVLGAADLVICTEGNAPPGAMRVQIISHRWFESVVTGKAEKDSSLPVLPPDAPLSDYFTSGTTGEAKHIIQTARMREHRTEMAQIRARFDAQSRFFIWPSFALQGIYVFAAACIRMGGCCVHNSRDGIAQMISKYRVSHMSVVPSVLAKTLDSLPAEFVKPDNLTVLTFGSTIENALRSRAESKLATALIETYSSNETGPISIVNSDGVGDILPGVEVEVVDEDHRSVWGKPASSGSRAAAVSMATKTILTPRQECSATAGFIPETPAL